MIQQLKLLLTLDRWFVSYINPSSWLLNLNQVFTISSLTLLSTTQLLPRNWSLSFSQGNSNFDQVTQYSNDGLYKVHIAEPISQYSKAFSYSKKSLLSWEKRRWACVYAIVSMPQIFMKPFATWTDVIQCLILDRPNHVVGLCALWCFGVNLYLEYWKPYSVSTTCTCIYTHTDPSLSYPAVHRAPLNGLTFPSEYSINTTFKADVIVGIHWKVAIAEVVITVSGSGLEEERGCGVCVEDLILNLDEIVVVIDNSSSLLGSINTTQEELLQGEIMESQVLGYLAS